MNRILLIICLFTFVCVSCKSKSQILVTNSAVKPTSNQQLYTLSLQDSLINFGRNYLRVPYRYGGTSPRGFDCSGFTSHVYGNFGYNLNRSSRDQATQFPIVQKRELQTGDLVFFEGRRKNKTVGHVGIVTNPKPNGEFDFIHASVQSGVIVSSSTEAYYANRYLKAGRVINNPSVPSFTKNTVSTSLQNVPTTSYQNPMEKNIVDATYYTVKKGDNLAAISKKYDVPISTIQQLNNLTSKRIKRGQKLLLAEAVSVPSIPVVEVQKIDFAKMDQGNEQHFIALEQPKSNTTQSSQVNQQHAASSQKLESQEKTDVVVFEQGQLVNQAGNRTHKVSAGESLFSIAKKYNLTVDELKSINGLNSNTINSGQMLNLSSLKPTPIPSETTIQAQSTPKPAVHIVKSGDTLYSIARQYNCSVSDLRKWNANLSDAIRVGEKIRVAF